MRGILPADCARACQQLSLRMDGELSEFEQVLLEAHLERCADCRAFGQNLTEFTTALRADRLERPSISFELPRKRGRVDTVLATSVRAASAAAALAVIVVSGVIALQGSNRGVGVAVADLRDAQAIIDRQERRMQELDTPKPSRVPRGLAAAKYVRPTEPLRPTAATRFPQGTNRDDGRR